MKLVIILVFISSMLTGCIDLGVNYHKHSQSYAHMHSSHYVIYTMRGGLGGVFSKGMNHLEDSLEERYKIAASSTVWYKGQGLTKTIIKNYEKHPHELIILVGHSLGANEQIEVADSLNKLNIPVALLITVDPVLPATVPSNVQSAINLYKPSFVPLFSGLKIKAADPKRTYIKNINVDDVKNMRVNHFTIDKHVMVQNIMLQHIVCTVGNKKDVGISCLKSV